MPSKIRALSSAELQVIAGELGVLVSSYFKNFYELGDGAFLLTFSKERKEVAVYVNLANTINLTEFRERVTAPTEFALAARKKLDGSRVETVEQHGSDRIIVIWFAGREKRRLIIEMFGGGNLLIVNSEGKIEQVYSGRDFKERSVKKGAQYAYPQQHGKPATEAVSDRMKEVGEGRFKTLSALMDSLYAEERSVAESPEKARELAELAASVDKLRKQVIEMSEKGEEYKKVANAIYAHLHEINETLEGVRKSKARSAEELQARGGIKVKKLDAKKKSITIELE